MADKCGKKALDVLKISGEELYQEVAEVYKELVAAELESKGKTTNQTIMTDK